MDTYGDMVTLLLTFFVMLYSMSSLNQQKWEIFVKSIFPNSSEEEQIAVNQPLDGEYDVSGDVTQVEEPAELETSADTLYLTLAERLNEMGISGVTLTRGEDYTFLEFKDKVFFDGDSSVPVSYTHLDVYKRQRIYSVYLCGVSQASGKKR